MAKVIQTGPWKGDALQQRSARHATVMRAQAAGATFLNDPGQAQNAANATGMVVVHIPGVSKAGKGYSGTGVKKPVYAVVDEQAWLGNPNPAGGGQTGGQVSGPAGATNAITRLPTGGGANIPTGLATISSEGADVKQEFEGINTRAAPALTNPTQAVDCQNVDGIRMRGSLGPRPGLIRMYPERDVKGFAVAQVRCIAKADFTADTDYILFDLGGTTHAFWFDTTGGDTEPAGSAAADNSYQVDISGDTTADDVSDTLETAINNASIGLAAADSSVDGNVNITHSAGGTLSGYSLTEFVTDSNFEVQDFFGGADAITSSLNGRSITALPFGFFDLQGDQARILEGYDSSSDLGSGASSSNQKEVRFVGPDMLWNEQFDIRGVKPNISESSNTGGTVTLSVSMPEKYRDTGNDTGLRQSVNDLVVRYSTVTYPQDRDGSDSTNSTVAEDYTDWDGTAKSVSISGQTSGDTLYVSVWALSKEHVSLVGRFETTVV